MFEEIFIAKHIFNVNFFFLRVLKQFYSKTPNAHSQVIR